MSSVKKKKKTTLHWIRTQKRCTLGINKNFPTPQTLANTISIWCFFIKLNTEFLYDPEISPLDIYWRIENRYSNKYLYTDIDNSTNHNSQNVETTQTSITKWIHKMQYIHTTKYYSVPKKEWRLIHTSAWINLKNILSEGNQTQKVTFYIIPFTSNTKNH